MSSIFRNAIKSRRKRKKARSTTPVNISSPVPKSTYPNKTSSSDFHDHCKRKANLPQQERLRVSRTTDEDDVMRQSPHEVYPSRRKSRSFESPEETDIPDDVHLASSSCDTLESTTDAQGKRRFLKSFKRRSKRGMLDNTNTGSSTTDSRRKSSSSNHDRSLKQPLKIHRRQRSRSLDGASQNVTRNDEFRGDIYTEPNATNAPTTSNNSSVRHHQDKSSRRKSRIDGERNNRNFSDTPDTIYSSGHTPTESASRRIKSISKHSSHDRTPSRRGIDTSDINTTPVQSRFDQNHQQQMRSSNPFITADRMSRKRPTGTTKTVIMNGDIVVCHSHNSKSSTDTALTSSASSNSKAKAKRRESERNARAAAALDDKGNDFFEKGYFDKAMACYTKALKLKRRTFAHLVQETDDTEEELILRGDNGDLADPQALVSMATSINNIGYLRQRSGDATPEETMAAYKKSLKIKRRILGNDSLSVGKTLNNIGSVHYLKRDFDRALSAYDEALEIMKANLGDKHPDVATVMSNIGDVYLAKNNKETSVKYYRLALIIRWEAFGEKSPRVVRLLEKISNLEIGDMSSMTSQKTHTAWGDDGASEKMVGSDFQPISEGLRLLQEQVRNDIELVDQMERKAAVEMLKDKIIIIRGMRDVWNGNASGPELLDNDSASVQTAMSRISIR